MKFTYEEVLKAYIKLKTYIYYDSTSLYMRKQLAVFETDLADDTDFLNLPLEYNSYLKEYKVGLGEDPLELYEKKLKAFTEALNVYHEQPQYFENFLQKIKARFLPKKIKAENEDSKIITNIRTSDKYIVTRSSVFIDAPIEIHLISVLWILRQGVDLDRGLFDGCLGNRLILNKDKNNVVEGSGLFKPYPKQYQKWRDDAVKVARQHLEKGENVLILNLDIRDFFYSVRIPKGQFDNSNNHDKRRTPKFDKNLFGIFSEIHRIFTEKLAKEYKTPYDFSNEVYSNGEIVNYILPIGLLSSFILANHYLVSFDNRIIKGSRPVHYGRYVDDILMVIANPLLPNEEVKDSIQELNFDFAKYTNWLQESKDHDDFEKISPETTYAKLSDLEQFVIQNFSPIITLIDTPDFLLLPRGTENPSSSKEHLFKLNGYKRLYCQSEKTLLYYFDKDESTLVIDKLKRDLEEKSSEFRNYSDASGEEDFEESAYHLLYDGTEGKVRTLKDYKEDKFGLSVYLSKRIFNALRRADKISDEDAEKIVRFFRGNNTLSLYTLWERVFVFFLVNNKAEAYVKFYLNCAKTIKRVELFENSVTVEKEDYQKDLFEFLDCANELALSLHPKFLSLTKKVKRTYEFTFNSLKIDTPFFQERYNSTSEKSYFMKRFRQSNLVRHQYTAQPLLTYTETRRNEYKNFTDLKIPF